MSSIYGTGPKGKATRLHSLVVRARAGQRCQRCGSTANLQAAHIIRRNHNNTRTDETNAWCLCGGCHMWLEAWHDEFMDFVEQTIGMDAYWELKTRGRSKRKWKDADWEAECERLSALLENWGEVA